jgi:hypothetical protein
MSAQVDSTPITSKRCVNHAKQSALHVPPGTSVRRVLKARISLIMVSVPFSNVWNLNIVQSSPLLLAMIVIPHVLHAKECHALTVLLADRPTSSMRTLA